MTPAAFSATARAVLGRDDWKRPLARLLRVPGRSADGIDPSLIRRWSRPGDGPPAWVEAQLAELAAERRRELDSIGEEATR